MKLAHKTEGWGEQQRVNTEGWGEEKVEHEKERMTICMRKGNREGVTIS